MKYIIKKKFFLYTFLNSLFGKKITSFLIKKGKKQTAEILIYKIFNLLKSVQIHKPLISEILIFKKALLNIMPFYENRTLKIKGVLDTTTLIVYNKKRRLFLTFKLLLKMLKLQKGIPFAIKFSNLIYSLYKQTGPKYNEFYQHRMDINKKYPELRYRWVL